MEDLYKQFNLPSYVKGKSFAEASTEIQRRFKDRTDKESIDTQRDLLTRLKEAQEYVKQKAEQAKQAQQEQQALESGEATMNENGQVVTRDDYKQIAQETNPEQQMQPEVPEGDMDDSGMPQQGGFMQQIQNCMGGKMKMHKYNTGGYIQGDANLDGIVDASDNVNNVAANTQGSKTAAGIGAAGSFVGMGMGAFGKTGVDTSGMQQVEKADMKSGVASGALQGATAGAMFGPWGAAIGGVVGGGLGAIQTSKQNKDAEKANLNYTRRMASIENPTFAYGGNPSSKRITDLYNKGLLNADAAEKANDPILRNAFRPATAPTMTEAAKQRVAAESRPGGLLLRPLEEEFTQPITKGTSDYLGAYGAAKEQKKQSDLDYWAAEADKAIARSGATGEEAIDPYAKETNIGKTIADSAEYLRYAPAAMNLYQLATLKKPKQEGLAKSPARYQMQLPDEEAYQRAVRSETNAARRAIRESSEGSGAAARANLLATQLGSTRAISEASLKAQELTNAEKRAAQQFNAEQDWRNIQQENLQQDINARNLGQYETAKSQLLAKLGDDVGAVGKEELYKKFPEMMNLSYDWRGKYQGLTPEQLEEYKDLQAQERLDRKKKYSKKGTKDDSPIE